MIFLSDIPRLALETFSSLAPLLFDAPPHTLFSSSLFARFIRSKGEWIAEQRSQTLAGVSVTAQFGVQQLSIFTMDVTP